jgi:hypothetical protein
MDATDHATSGGDVGSDAPPPGALGDLHIIRQNAYASLFPVTIDTTT